MRTIKLSKRFKRDYRREKSGVLGKKLDALLREALEFLVAGAPLPPKLEMPPWSISRKSP
jgi:mRNA interferase YafQ